MEVFMNKNVLSLLATSMSVLLFTDCAASCLEELDQAEHVLTKVAVQNNTAASSTSKQVPTENEEASVNPVVAFFENMPKEKHKKFLIKVGISSGSDVGNFPSYYCYSDFESEDTAKAAEAAAKWEKTQRAIQKGSWTAARAVAEYLQDSGKLEECRVYVESLCSREKHDGARNFGLFAKVEGYTNGYYGFEQEKDPSKARAILEQGKKENDQYLTYLYWEGVMNGKHGFSKPGDLSAFHAELFILANAGDKNLRQQVIEGYWCGYNSFSKDLDAGQRLNDLYIEEEIKEPFDWNLRDSSAIIRKLKGLTLDSRSGDMYCYSGDVHALEQFLEKLKTEGSIEVQAFSNFLHTALKADIEFKKQEEARRQEELRRAEERKRQEELRRQEEKIRSKKIKIARSGVSVTVSPSATPSTNNGKFNFSGK